MYLYQLAQQRIAVIQGYGKLPHTMRKRLEKMNIMSPRSLLFVEKVEAHTGKWHIMVDGIHFCEDIYKIAMLEVCECA